MSERQAERLDALGITIHRAGRRGDIIQTMPPSWVVIHRGRTGHPRYLYCTTRREAERLARDLADSVERMHRFV